MSVRLDSSRQPTWDGGDLRNLSSKRPGVPSEAAAIAVNGLYFKDIFLMKLGRWALRSNATQLTTWSKTGCQRDALAY